MDNTQVNPPEMRSLTEAEVSDVSGGVASAILGIGIGVWLGIGMMWENPKGSPTTLDEYYASW